MTLRLRLKGIMEISPASKSFATNAKVVRPAERASRYGDKDVWGIFSPLALEHKSVNLGQGFPNIPAAKFIKEAVGLAVNQDLNQYAPSRGLPRLLSALSDSYSSIFEKPLDQKSEIMVTQGANQGIAVALQAFIEPGDEVILIEPFFDIYKPSVEVSGGKVVAVPLRLQGNFDSRISASQWRLDISELESKITPKTKAIIFNNPHNPTGKLFTRSELEELAAIAVKHNLLVFSDDVYDRLVYDRQQLTRIATLPGMWERTLTFGSAGKTFGVTGWRIGWIIGAERLLKYVLAVHARTVFTSPTPLQDAVAAGLEHAKESGYFERTCREYQDRRDKTIKIFTDLGLPVAVPEGSYFFMVDTSKIQVDLPRRPSEEVTTPNVFEPRDYAISRWMTTEIGVTPIPPSAFYLPQNKHLAENLIRICFCKTDELLEEARARLQKLRKYICK